MISGENKGLYARLEGVLIGQVVHKSLDLVTATARWRLNLHLFCSKRGEGGAVRACN